FGVQVAGSAPARDARTLEGSVSPATGTIFPPGTTSVPYAWKLELPSDCNTNLPWRNGILGTGFFIGPAWAFEDGKPRQGLFGRDAADDFKLEGSGSAGLIWPGQYTMWAYGSCVNKTSGGPRIEFETPRTTFFLRAKLSTLKIRSNLKIGEIRSKGIDLFLICGKCTGASFVAALVPGGKPVGTLTRLTPPNRSASSLPLPGTPPLSLKLSAAGKAKLATLKTANIQVRATVSLIDGETQVVTAKATFAR
ncbi:MAG: hypothetical protein MSC30_11620, partial [Gaiellaceae bacterium MAG52_C11]|nr:hypothetical protein [Candidatus Gaiellasilicea maunaloa]